MSESERESVTAGADGGCDVVTVIRPRVAWRLVDVGELVRYRDLGWMLAVRDIRVRYKQTGLGVLWALIQPLAMAGILLFLMGNRLGVEEMTDPGYVLAGVLPWTLFAAVVTASTNSLVGNADIITKVYFPRVLVPFASAGAPVLDYLIGLVVLCVVLIWWGGGLGAGLLLVVPVTATVLCAGLGLGLVLGALSVSYRDFRHAVPFLVQMMFFLTPVIYPGSAVPEGGRMIAALNPMVGAIDAMRGAVSGGGIDYGAWCVSAAAGLVLMVMGLAYFARVERRFADIV